MTLLDPWTLAPSHYLSFHASTPFFCLNHDNIYLLYSPASWYTCSECSSARPLPISGSLAWHRPILPSASANPTCLSKFVSDSRHFLEPSGSIQTQLSLLWIVTDLIIYNNYILIIIVPCIWTALCGFQSIIHTHYFILGLELGWGQWDESFQGHASAGLDSAFI